MYNPSTRPLVARRLHARGPRLFTGAATRRALLICVEDCESARVIGYLVVTSVERTGKPAAYTRIEGVRASDESRAWRLFADRVNEFAAELERVQSEATPDPWSVPRATGSEN